MNRLAFGLSLLLAFCSQGVRRQSIWCRDHCFGGSAHRGTGATSWLQVAPAGRST